MRGFVYVSVLHAARHPGVAYLDAHARVAQAVRDRGLEHAIIEPTGFYSALRALLEMAQKNQAVVFGDGRARSNPIDDRDLALIAPMPLRPMGPP